MQIRKENIKGYGCKTAGLVSLRWKRTATPYINDNKEELVDSVEFEMDSSGIEKLERNIEQDKERIICFVHFRAGTDYLLGIYFSVRDENASQDDAVLVDLSDEEKSVLKEYALQFIKAEREHCKMMTEKGMGICSEKSAIARNVLGEYKGVMRCFAGKIAKAIT